MIEVEIIKHYGTKDKLFGGECDTELKIDGVVLKRGDQYHDKMDEFTEGVLQTLSFLINNNEINSELKIVRIDLNDEEGWN